jgi:hypothetical protein
MPSATVGKRADMGDIVLLAVIFAYHDGATILSNSLLMNLLQSSHIYICVCTQDDRGMNIYNGLASKSHS